MAREDRGHPVFGFSFAHLAPRAEEVWEVVATEPDPYMLKRLRRATLLASVPVRVS